MHVARSTNCVLPHGWSRFNPLVTNQDIVSIEPINGAIIEKINNMINSTKLNSSLIKDIIDRKKIYHHKYRGRITIHGLRTTRS